jgi:UDP-N-acetylglucosamine 1-carboxyvinyltransferase
VEEINVSGGKQLHGVVQVSGSKNGTLPLLAASLLIEGETIIDNVPDIVDVRTMMDVLRALGAKCEFVVPHTLRIDATNITRTEAPYDLVNKMRASFYVAGSLLARIGEARVPMPGGCFIGNRPVDQHLEAFRALGGTVELKHGVMCATARRLRGARLMLDARLRSVGATINILLASVLADGNTIIENASREPEVVCCARFLIDAGADITGVGTTTLVIKGVKRLHDLRFASIPDRMEAGTFMYAALAAGGDIVVQDCVPRDMDFVLDVLREAGAQVSCGPDFVRVRAHGRPLPVDAITAPYPGFPTDLQPCHGVLCSVARGTSSIEETIHDSRFNYADALRRMGADIRMVGHQAAIFRGVPRLAGCPVEATDMRAAAALVVAGLAAQGETEVSGAGFLDRGYEAFERKLSGLGARVWRARQTDASEELCLA